LKKIKVSKAKDVSFRKIIVPLIHAFGINLINVLAIRRVTNVFVSMDTMELIVKLKKMSVKVFLVKMEVSINVSLQRNENNFENEETRVFFKRQMKTRSSRIDNAWNTGFKRSLITFKTFNV
jgi:hypothetical protein